ncbi:putative lipoprotein [Lysobacter antibioticus]|uniref:hypothetical protein n=1 Tax=Lysobacter antibioticus TaxID=84531 RepID=UPI000717386A|nr:hypothetical protein [Lysobacter antibioticus]ALN63110.1 putative lipoprotein [Lysobacter antibioticus]
MESQANPSIVAVMRAWIVLGSLALGACADGGGTTPAGANQVRASEAGAGQVGASQIGATQADAAGVATPQVDAAQVGAKGQVEQLRLEAVTELPRYVAPTPALADDGSVPECAGEAKSSEARAAVAAGWTIRTDMAWGKDYRVVGVAPRATQVAGFGCMFPAARVLFFRDGRAVAQLRDLKADEESFDSGVQGVFEHSAEPAEPAGKAGSELRVGEWQVARARVLATAAGLELTALPALDAYCGGAAKVPRIEGLSLPQARAKLLAQGWRGVQPDREEGAERFLGGLIEAGYPEVVDCAGTGQGYCSFEYAADAGHGLAVTTAGEHGEDDGKAYWPTVVGSEVTCAAKVTAAPAPGG